MIFRKLLLRGDDIPGSLTVTFACLSLPPMALHLRPREDWILAPGLSLPQALGPPRAGVGALSPPGAPSCSAFPTAEPHMSDPGCTLCCSQGPLPPTWDDSPVMSRSGKDGLEDTANPSSAWRGFYEGLKCFSLLNSSLLEAFSMRGFPGLLGLYPSCGKVQSKMFPSFPPQFHCLQKNGSLGASELMRCSVWRGGCQPSGNGLRWSSAPYRRMTWSV